MNRSLFFAGLLIWAGATVLLRLLGQRFFSPDHLFLTGAIFLLSFPLMALLSRRLCWRFRVTTISWHSAAISLALPTLFLDAFSSSFFAFVFPNLAPQMAGVFGGWMLWCCAGALTGVLLPGSGAAHRPTPRA